MKKLIIILLVFIPFISQAARAYQQSWIDYVTADINTGKLNIMWRQTDKSVSPSENMFDLKIYWRLPGTTTWNKVYDQSVSTWPKVTVTQPTFDQDRREMVITGLPGAFFQQTVEVRFFAKWSGGSGHDQFPDFTFTLNNKVKPLSNPAASDGSLCNLINLTWTIPSYGTPTTQTATSGVQVFFGHNNVSNLAGYTTGNFINRSYTLADAGVDKDFTIRPILTYPDNRVAVGESVNVTGKTTPLPDTPSSLILNQANCNGAIDVEWSWPVNTNPTNFIIQKSTDPNFIGITNTYVSGNDDDYRDVSTTSGNIYYYRIFAQNACATNSPVSEIIGNPSVPDTIVGNGVPPATVVSSISTDPVAKSVTVNWVDNTHLEDEFTVVRNGSGTTQEFAVAKNISSYIDATAATCTTYTYSVKTKNSCNTAGAISTNSKTALLPADVLTTFDTGNNKVQASDGEFGDRIDLQWKTANRQNETWIITRTDVLTNNSIQIASLPASSKFYTDNSANANTLYEYEIQGELNCDTAIKQSNTTKDVGFRLAFGTVNGQVTYQGGTAVKGVKVTAAATAGASGSSGDFSDTSAVATVTNNTSLESDSFTIMAFVKPTAITGVQSIASKIDPTTGTTGWDFKISNGSIALYAGTQLICAGTSPDLTAGSWVSVAATVSNDSVKLFVKGKKVKAESNITTVVINTTNDLKLGSSLTGNMDEVKYYTRPLTDLEVERSFDVYINPSDKGLRGYWRFDEAFGNTAYDYSKTLLTPNKNRAILTSVVWSSQKPTSSQLTAGAYTDSLGSYFIPFIPYLGTGDNYTITPQFGTHSFTPATTTLLIGSGSANYNGKDFLDNSSFRVTGTAKYDGTNCFVKDARLKIDGEVVVANGEVVMTLADGSFEVQVPIGPHVVSIEKTSHEFSAGRFPTTGTHDFQQNVSGINFIDSTLVKVVGRVAGGGLQKDLPPALGRGKNNIGKATIPFKAQQGGGCHTDNVMTDAITGEYEIFLPPIKYEIPNFTVTSNSAIGFLNNALLDISNVPPEQTSRDGVDSTTYQSKRDFIHSVGPSIDVLGKKNPTQYGADSVGIDVGGVKIQIKDTTLAGLAHPVFEENKTYEWIISAFEIYENKDGLSTILDSVPMVEGKILITNDLASSSRKEFEYSLNDSIKFNGIQEYSFKAGQANTSEDGQNANNSFSKECQISVTPKVGQTVQWKPNNNFFRGIIFGGRALGSNFSTDGPDVVTMVLRDPPGTGSFASWTKETTTTTIYSYENEAGIGTQFNLSLALGTKFSVGLGYTTETKVQSNLNTNTTTQTNINASGEVVETTANSETLSTGDGEEFVGAGADLFFGKAMNMDFGLAQNLTLIEVANCGGNITCVGDTITQEGKNYRLGTKFSMFAIPGGYETHFVFTQAGIENSVIPKLEALRNNLLLNDTLYTSKLTVSDPNFGTSNDDPIWANRATPNPEKSGVEDKDGVSYEFKGYSEETRIQHNRLGIPISVKVTVGKDEVWFYNKQIRLWEDAIKDNEKAKVLAANPEKNISYQGGSSISFSSTSERSEASSTNINFSLDEALSVAIGAEVGGAGSAFEQGISLSYNRSTTNGTGNATSTTFDYTILDPDGDDEFSVDVFKPTDGFGPIFKTRGGQTSCPYQGEVKTKYYQPGTILDQATIQLEQPRITASPASIFNVPSDGQGNINLSLINDGLEDAVYSLKVLEPSNPHGLILKIDGITPNRDFPVPAQTSISKLLTVEKGPIYIEYDSIALVFHSTCQYAFGTANYDDIADTVYISVNFLPSCTELNVQSPQNQFIANTSFDQKLPVIISGYDINYSGLDKIQLQYKPSNQASWVPLGREWFKDTTDIKTRHPNHSDPSIIPTNQSYINYELELSQLIDQNYDLRAISTCNIPFNPTFSQESSVISGIVDRVNPHPFGTPSPADGVLDPNDDISIQFNETIEAGSLTANNFQITGVLNGQQLRHDIAVAFDGATSYMEIDNGFDFTSNDFTIEFWAKRGDLGRAQKIISQGSDSSNAFSIGFDSQNKLEVQLGAYKAKSNFTVIDDSTWHHYTVTYDRDNITLELTDRDVSSMRTFTNGNFSSNYNAAGKTYIGKNASKANEFFNGSIHQFRIWNKVLSSSEVSSRINLNLSGREAGLIGFWPMDEGRGNLAADIARFRNAEVLADWELNPKSTAIALDGINQFVAAQSAGELAISNEMDLSIEFWFKTTGGRTQTFLSNGGGRLISYDANRNGWNIEMNSQNEIWVKNDSTAFKASNSTSFADNKWHHFALVVNRLTDTRCYIDGLQQQTISSSNFFGFGADKLVIGARYSKNGTLDSLDQFYKGGLDEIRIWNKTLLRENIELNRFNRLSGDEFGLLAYFPFESHRLELGVSILDTSLANQSNVLANPSNLNATAINGSSFYTNESPSIALQKPVLAVNYAYSVNNDKIVIIPNEVPANIENVTLSVSVKDVKDLHGNKMLSPKTWIAFVNKNQVLWQDAEKNLTKEFNAPLTFTSQIINRGGDVKAFTISNIPTWLTASTSSGTINPLSTRAITFTINPAINIGDYAEDLMLTTDFGFNEKLLVNLKVRKTPPTFNFDRNLYGKSMNVIGQIKINGNISNNNEDILIAYINDEIRGKANLQYMETLDRYMVFLDIYSNTSDSVKFKVWNSAEGELHEDVTPNLNFVENTLIGNVLSPQVFNAVNKLAKPIVLNAGWNWVSFPLTDTKMSGLHTFFSNTNFSSGDLVKTNGNNAFAQYGGPSLGWSGGLTRNGLNNHQSYLIHISTKDTLMYSGLAIDPDTVPISVAQGWNRIGFVSTKNVEINSALANFNATDGDLIKSQQAFAVYVNNLGWVGSLTAMESTEGYLLKAADSATFVYPRRGLLRLKEEPVQQKLEDVMPALYELNPNAFEASTNAIIKVNTCEELLANEDWSLAAFKNHELRGFVKSTQFVDEELGHEYFITVYGEGNETYTFKMINQTNGEQMEVNAKLDFEKNKLQGEVTNPLQFNLFTEVDCDQFKVEEQIASEDEQLSYPNPFSRFVTIVVPNSITETGQVQIIDKNGRTVFNRDVEDQRKFHLNGAELYFLANGVYTLKFTDGETVVTEKLVRIK